MKKLLFFASILCFTVFANNTLLAQYSNATLNGPWFMDTIPAQIYSPDNTNYLVFDGNGNIIDFSGNGNGVPITGNYSVTTGGSISWTLVDGSRNSYPFSGQLISQNSGNITTMMSNNINFSLSKITNPGALTDSLVGIISNPNCGQKNITLRLNSYGQIIYASGLTLPVTGRVYADLGHFEGHIKTGDNTEWCSCGSLDEFTIVGAYSNDSLNGVLAIDGSKGGCRDVGTVHLKRFGKVTTGVIPIASSIYKLIFYPNPGSDIVSFKIDNTNNADLTLNIYNVIGTLIKSEPFKQDNRQINIGDLSNGIYMVTIKTKEWNGKQKLIIQR